MYQNTCWVVAFFQPLLTKKNGCDLDRWAARITYHFLSTTPHEEEWLRPRNLWLASSGAMGFQPLLTKKNGCDSDSPEQLLFVELFQPLLTKKNGCDISLLYKDGLLSRLSTTPHEEEWLRRQL